MSMIAHRIGSVPTKGFDWYIIFLEGEQLTDEISEQIDKHFTRLGKVAGERTLVVRGYDSTEFRTSVEAHALHGTTAPVKVDAKEPALLVTDAVPKSREEKPGQNSGKQDIVEPFKEAGGLDNARVMLFPLRPIFERDKNISTFLDKLLSALHDTDPRAIEKLRPTTIEKCWDWLTKYFGLNPTFYGVGPKFDKIIGDALKRAR
jgi:hypothetical protein